MGSKWTIEDLQRLADRGVKVEGLSPKLKLKSDKPSKKEPEAIRHILEVLWMLKIDHVQEYQFHPARKWRFDVALVDKMIGIEYEGLMAAKSRHTTISGFSNDCTKYNQANVCGWKVLRYTAVNYKEFYNDIKTILGL